MDVSFAVISAFLDNFCCDLSIMPEYDAPHRQLYKRLQRKKEISPFYISKQIQPLNAGSQDKNNTVTFFFYTVTF